MATLYRPYTALADVRRETKHSDSSLDDWYIECINMASRLIDDYCKRDFWFHDYSVAPYKVNRRRVLEESVVLPFPIITLTEVRVFTDIEQTSDSNDIWETDEYHFEEGERTIHAEAETEWKYAGNPGRFGSYPFRGFLWIKGTFGYPLTTESGAIPDETPPPTIPTGVRRAATLIASAFSSELRKEQIGLDGVRVELLDTRIPREAKILLSRYKDNFETTF